MGDDNAFQVGIGVDIVFENEYGYGYGYEYGFLKSEPDCIPNF